MELKVLFWDEDILVVDKPCGMMVHRSPISSDQQFVLQLVRDQVGRFVYPVHRLDRATSGVLVFGLNSASASHLCRAFSENRVRKEYLAVVRGYLEGAGAIDYALENSDTGVRQDAVTLYECLARVEIPEAVRPHPTARYSLVRLNPRQGRRHQIRRHLKHVFHPVIGDVRYGDGKHNQLFRDRFGIQRLLLHSISLTLEHPCTGEPLYLAAPPPAELLQLFGNAASLPSLLGLEQQRPI